MALELLALKYKSTLLSAPLPPPVGTITVDVTRKAPFVILLTNSRPFIDPVVMVPPVILGPNISSNGNVTTGSINGFNDVTNRVSGCLRVTSPARTLNGGGAGNDDAVSLFFDANDSNSIYGNSSAVQPKSLTCLFIIKT